MLWPQFSVDLAETLHSQFGPETKASKSDNAFPNFASIFYLPDELSMGRSKHWRNEDC